jgi:transposase InsO family protein
VLKVSRAAYYDWSNQRLSARAQADVRLTTRIAAIHARSRNTYCAPRVHAERLACGEHHGRQRIARLLRLADIKGRYPRRFRTTVSDPFTALPDLVQRNFTPTRPDELWVGDITYIRTWQGWLYLAAILDCYSRRVVGWSMADHLRTELPLDALPHGRGPAPPSWDPYPPHRSRLSARAQGVHATRVVRDCLDNNSSSASPGVRQSRVLRGRALSVAATASRCSRV